MNQGTFNTLSDVLKSTNKIIIPDLQRDYCWGTVLTNHNRKSLTYNFTTELIKEAENELNYNEFSYGIIYTYEYPKSFLYLCDGQQRLTTLYLIIGALNCYQENEKLSDLLQFNNGQPRLKYEVRNTTDYFINDLVNLTFKNKNKADLKDVSKASWFRDNYKDDPSIKNVVIALTDISNLINQSNFEAVTDFILNKIGFVYINLEAKEEGSKLTYSKIREYGEKMYEIVNTCGDPMEANEHQKSLLLSKISDEKKKEWTSKWEIWQDFFWVNRGSQLSADEGFNEFLSWVKRIEETEEYSIEIVEEYFRAFFLLITTQGKLLVHRTSSIKDLQEEFLRNQKPNLMVLYPALIYLKNSPGVKFEQNKYYVDDENINHDELFRYIRFFSNVSRNTEAIEIAIKLAKYNEHNDVINFLKIQSDEFKTILSEEEIQKLMIYANCLNGIERENIENTIWLAEDENYLNGIINPLFDWMHIIYPNNEDGFKLSEFEKIYHIFRELINKKNIEKLRIAILVYSENFSDFREGWSWGCERFYLGTDNDFTFWRRWIASKELKKIIEPYSNNTSLDIIITNELNKQTDNYRKIIIRYLFSNTSKIWQWNNTKRYFIYGKEICFPNGVQAKEKTEIKTIL